MEIFLLWILFSFFVGLIGSGRNIGFFGAFFLSLLLSPLIGLIFALVSESTSSRRHKEQMLKLQKEQAESLKTLNTAPSAHSPASELEKLAHLRTSGVISDTEYEKLKQKVIA
jgi:hypothetical protein